MSELNLLALMMRRRLGVAGVQGVSPGRYRIEAGGMSALIEVPASGPATVRADDGSAVDASVRGGMRSLLAVLVGRVGVVRAALTGRVSARGRVWRLLSLLAALRR